MSVTQRLAPVEVLDIDGEAIRLGELLKDRLTVLVFIRHFG